MADPIRMLARFIETRQHRLATRTPTMPDSHIRISRIDTDGKAVDDSPWIDQALERDERMAIEAPLLEEISRLQAMCEDYQTRMSRLVRCQQTIRAMAKDMADGRLSNAVVLEWCARIVSGIDAESGI